jgi:amino acid adenylation domain-containing protein
MAEHPDESEMRLTAVEFDPFALPELQQVFPATDAQRELWAATQISTEASLAFNEASTLRLKGPLQPAILQQAITVLVARHTSLRLTFSADGRQGCVAAQLLPELVCHDLTNLPAAERAGRVQALVTREVETPFALETGPLFRFSLVREAACEHRLLFTAHHLVCDGSSTGVLLTELGELYRALSRGAPFTGAAAPQFPAYAEDFAAYRQSAAWSADEHWWLAQLRGELPVLELPLDRLRPPIKTYAAQREDVRLPAGLLADCRRVGARQGASLFATLLAAWEALLLRLCGQDDIIVAVPFSGQAQSGHPSLVGHCVNTLPLRIQIARDRPFAELLSAVKSLLLDASEHQRYGFGSLLQRLALPRDPGRLPLATVLFNLDRALPAAALDWGEVRGTFAATPRRFENFDLFVNAVEEEDGDVTLECQYNVDLLSAETVRRWMACYAELLAAVARNPDTTIERLPWVSAHDAACLAAWNRTRVEFPRQQLVPDLIAAQVARSPAAEALVCGDETLSYAQLDEHASRIAAALHRVGVTPGERVGVYLDRTPWLVAAVLGVLKAGAAYVPLDPAFPAERLRYMIADASLRVVVTQETLVASLPDPSVTAVMVERGVSAAWVTPLSAATPEACAYVIYTSGSTGQPKGVEVPHRAVVNFLTSMAREPGLTASDTLLAVTTLSFDIAGLELLLPLTVGARIILARREEAASGAALRTLLETHGVTVMQGTPATWRLLLAAGWTGCANLRALVGGEAVPLDLARELSRNCGAVFNLYGPTETTVWSTCYRLARQPNRVLIGRPIANTTVHVLDPLQQPVPIGVFGELYIGGEGVARGYLGRSDLTAERFVADPWMPGQRLYRTGDVGRYLPDGQLEYQRRNDTQVKLRGYRIELGEIETVLAAHPGVAQAAVLVRDVQPQDARLVAYLVPVGTAEASLADQLRTYLRDHLPEYMVPQHFICLPAMPLTPNAKVDRIALPPLVLAATAEPGFVAPRTAAEEQLARIWQEALGLPRISVTEDFFRLGGHSLLAAQILARLATEHGVALGLRDFLGAPTIAGLAARLLATGSQRAMVIPRRPDEAPLQLSLLQQRLWFLEQLDPGETIFHLPAAYRLQGPLHVAVLQQALQALAARQEVLRTSLSRDGDEARPGVTEAMTLALPETDLRALPAAEREREWQRLMASEMAAPFDLTRGPLVRLRLYRLAATDNLLFFMPHHLIWDGWSFDIFVKELDLLYTALAAGQPSPLSPLPIRYRDFAAWHHDWLQGAALADQMAFWKTTLAGDLPVLEMPSDFPRPAEITYRGGFIPLTMGAAELEPLRQLAKSQHTTLYVLLLTAFSTLLHRYTAQEELLIGTPVRGRNWPETEDICGFFVNTLVMRTTVKNEERFTATLARVKQTVMDALAHADLPFDLLVKELKIPRDLSRTPVYQAFFSFQDVRERHHTLGDLSCRQVHVMPEASPTEICLWLMEQADGLVGGLNFSSDLFARSSMERFLRHLRLLLSSLAADATTEIGEIDLLPEADRRRLAEWNATQCDGPAAVLLQQPMEALAAAQPEALALRCGSTTLTRGELHSRANELAHRLQAAGVGRDALVGLHLERGLEMVVAALGILKAGGAYLPLDPSFPRERLDYMIQDSGIRWIVTAPSLAATLAPQHAHVIDGTDLCAVRFAAPSCPADADSRAYVLYTSGSSGKPKGVEVTHRNVTNFLASMRQHPGLQTDDVLLAVTTLSFDIAVLELFLPLWTGAVAVVATQDEVADGRALTQLIRQHQVTMLQATPATWRLLLDAEFCGGPAFTALVGGEAVPLTLAQELRARCARLFNMYGPTETTVWSTCYEFPQKVDEVLIGRPIRNTRVHLRDARGRPTPLGIPGELVIGGDGVARGYLNRPALTAERFVVDRDTGERLYRTGDVVRLRDDGNLEYLRRMDTQVKVRGYRIELGEIEAALGTHPAVACAVAAVVAMADEVAGLVAYVIARPEARFTESELRKYLRQILPPYMVPQRFVELDVLPLTPNGKVDRKRLPAVSDEARSEPTFVPPANEHEAGLAALWCEELRLTRVGRQDNFFDLGGHSLLALRLLLRIEQRFGLRLSPRVLLLSTLAQVAAQLPELKTQAEPAVSLAAIAGPAAAPSRLRRFFRQMGTGRA